MQVKEPPLGPVGPKSHPWCDAAGIPAVLEDLLLLHFRVSEMRNVSSQWRKLGTDFVLVVGMGNLNVRAGERLFLDVLCSFLLETRGEKCL